MPNENVSPRCAILAVVSWCLFFKVNLFQVFTNLLFYLNQSAPTLIRRTNLFCFLWVGKPQIALTGGNRAGICELFPQTLVWSSLCGLRDVLTNRVGNFNHDSNHFLKSCTFSRLTIKSSELFDLRSIRNLLFE